MRLFITRSLWRKLAVAVVAIVGFVLLYEVSMFESDDATPQGPVVPTLPVAGSRLLFTATAYCKGTTTASGVRTRTGIAASDPALLPLGSVVNITTEDTKYTGVYTIMDTGPAVQGRHVDLYMWSCYEALDFGRQQIELTVMRLGWDPGASTPSLVDRLFRRREAARTTAPAAPPAPAPNDADSGDDAMRATEPVDGAAETGSEPSNPAPSDAPVGPVAPSSPAPPVAPEGTPAP